jgi:hypothetical protein
LLLLLLMLLLLLLLPGGPMLLPFSAMDVLVRRLTAAVTDLTRFANACMQPAILFYGS